MGKAELLALGGLFFLEFFVISMLLSPEWVQEQVDREIAYTELAMGRKATEALVEQSESLFERAFLNTGIYEHSFRIFIPTDERLATDDMAPLGHRVFPYVEDRLLSIWRSVYQVIYRACALVGWFPYFALLLVPALLDGMVMRRVAQTGFRYSSPVLYRLNMKASFWIAVLLLFSLFLPFALSPWIIPFAAALMAACLAFMMSHMQKIA